VGRCLGQKGPDLAFVWWRRVVSSTSTDRDDLRGMLQRAEESLAAAIGGLKVDHEAAVDEVLAARLLIATAAVSLAQGVSPIG